MLFEYFSNNSLYYETTQKHSKLLVQPYINPGGNSAWNSNLALVLTCRTLYVYTCSEPILLELRLDFSFLRVSVACLQPVGKTNFVCTTRTFRGGF